MEPRGKGGAACFSGCPLVAPGGCSGRIQAPSGTFGSQPRKLFNLFLAGWSLLIKSFFDFVLSDSTFFLFCMDSCMESAEGKRMIQKYEAMLSLLER